jgi:FHS family L-fucose permease-like MFS transporter
VVVVQVVANPLISLLGPAKTVHSRLTFAQAFNSLGTTIFPRVGSALILGSLAGVSAAQLSGPALDAYRTAETRAIVDAYTGLAIALAVIALAVFLFRHRLKNEQHEHSSPLAGFSLLRRPRFGLGALCIFLYVGAEVAIGSLIVNYLMQPGVMSLDEQGAGNMIMYYWGGAMVGRFIGSLFLRLMSPGKILAGVAVGAITLILISINTDGAVSGYSLLAIGLMNSIMFPTIFSLACEGLGPKAADGSGIINIAIFGGAVVPLLTGVIADVSGSLGIALLLPAACYAIIAYFGIYARRPASG